MTTELAVLQAARLKGRLSPELAAASSGVDLGSATETLSTLCDAGLVKGESSVRLTPEGRQRLAELLEAERAEVDGESLAALYEEFDHHNTDLKQIISDWQLKDGEPNDHTDEQYDHSVMDRLETLDSGFQGLVARIAEVAPRLHTFQARFTNALNQIRAGDASFVARPITDSYHTVWFEFHEELIGLLGLSREQEAAAGRAV